MAGPLFAPGREGSGRSPSRSVFWALGSILRVWIERLVCRVLCRGLWGPPWMGQNMYPHVDPPVGEDKPAKQCESRQGKKMGTRMLKKGHPILLTANGQKVLGEGQGFGEGGMPRSAI